MSSDTLLELSLYPKMQLLTATPTTPKHSSENHQTSLQMQCGVKCCWQQITALIQNESNHRAFVKGTLGISSAKDNVIVSATPS